MGRRQAQGVELRGIESQWAARLDAEEAIAWGNGSRFTRGVIPGMCCVAWKQKNQ